jgi:hypothetical protein
VLPAHMIVSNSTSVSCMVGYEFPQWCLHARQSDRQWKNRQFHGRLQFGVSENNGRLALVIFRSVIRNAEFRRLDSRTGIHHTVCGTWGLRESYRRGFSILFCHTSDCRRRFGSLHSTLRLSLTWFRRRLCTHALRLANSFI